MHQQKNTITIWTMWLLASFFYAYQYVLRVLPNIMMVDIFEKFHIDANIFGQYSGLYYIGYAGMLIPLGILLDKYGPKKILSFCMLLATLGITPLLFAHHWIYPSLGRILIGMGSAGAILGVFKIIRMSFAEEKFTLMLGFSVTIGLVGAIYGGQPVNYLMHTFGSDIVLTLIILIGIFLAIITYLITPSHVSTQSNYSWIASVKTVFTHPQVIIICLLAGCMVGPLEGFADVWGKEFLKTVYNLSENAATSLPSLIFLGMCFGSPLLSWFVSKTKSYFTILIVSAFVMGIAFILLLTGQLPTQSLPIIFMIVGIFCAYQILAIYLASTFMSEQLAGLTTACANMIIMSFGYIFHSFIGKIMTLQWDGQMQNGIPVYNAADYTQALMVIPVGLIMAGFGYIWMVAMAKKSKRPARLTT